MENERVNVKFDFRGKIRRVTVQSVDELKEKVRQSEPNFCGYLAWIDEDSDKIAVESADDFTVAVEVFKATGAGSCLKLVCVESEKPAVHIADDSTSEDSEEKHTSVVKTEHPFIFCDNCEQSDECAITGIRYKCAVCPDYDLCERCEKRGIHAYHAMIRYVTPDTPKVTAVTTADQQQHFFPQGHGCPFKTMNLQEFFDSRNSRKEAKERRREQRQARREARRSERSARTTLDQQKEIERLIAERAAKVRNNVRTGVEYLKEIGGQLQQALMNFGIDCDVDVEHKGQRYPLKDYLEKEEAERKKKEEAETLEKQPELHEENKPEITTTPLQRPSSIPFRHPAPADIYQSLMQQVATPSEVLERAAAMMHTEKEKYMPKAEEQEVSQSERELRECGEALAKQAAERLTVAINSQQQAQETAYLMAMQAASQAISKLSISEPEQNASQRGSVKSFVNYSDSETDPEDEKTVHDIVDVSEAPTPNPTPAITQTNTPPSEMEQRGDGDWFVVESNNTVRVQGALAEEVRKPSAPADDTEHEVPEVIFPDNNSIEAEEIPVCTAGIPMHVPGRNSIRSPGPHNPQFGYIHPRPHIQKTAEIMVAMGYDNCNGWLTRLSEENDGDINRVVEAAQRDPLHLQRLQRL